MSAKPIPSVAEAIELARTRGEQEPNTGCWLWPGATSKGYAAIGRGGRRIRLSRLILGLGKMDRPDDVFPVDGQLACHTCDTPLCVNPDHLYVGTPRDNNADIYKRGRQHRGKDRCKRGHLYDRRHGHQPICNQCNRIWRRLRAEKNRRELCDCGATLTISTRCGRPYRYCQPCRTALGKNFGDSRWRKNA